MGIRIDQLQDTTLFDRGFLLPSMKGDGSGTFKLTKIGIAS